MRKRVLHPILGNSPSLSKGNYVWGQNISYMLIKNIIKEKKSLLLYYKLFFKTIAGFRYCT